jgi:hypothetical protein
MIVLTVCLKYNFAGSYDFSSNRNSNAGAHFASIVGKHFSCVPKTGF